VGGVEIVGKVTERRKMYIVLCVVPTVISEDVISDFSSVQFSSVAFYTP